MTISQEDALYEFLENVAESFTVEDIIAFIRLLDSEKNDNLAAEIASFIDSRNIAFRLGNNRWVSRRACFEPIRFVISPTRLELLNGVLIPGHRCVPFANPVLLPQEYVFYRKLPPRGEGSAKFPESPIPVTTLEGPPEDFYPYYSIFGEEYAPQYVARDNPENESAFNGDPYEDPPEVSIHVLDMRNIYRETAFVPGDRFVVSTRNWKEGIFELERVGKDTWSQMDLYAWVEAAEAGFEDSFTLLGPGASTEEQIAYAYWYGGKRMRDIPAYALEDFLYEQTDRIETVAYGIETRFWFAGKEIPNSDGPGADQLLPDRTPLEDMLFQRGVPVSEYVIQSYVRDAFFRNDLDIPRIIERIVPSSCNIDEADWKHLGNYIADTLDEFKNTYSLFTDKAMGPIRQRVGELHTAVIDLTARLHGGGIDPSCLPKHTYVILSQIQGHAAGILEDLDTDEAPPETELEAMDNSLDSMIETYEDIKELIDEALDNFRQNNISMVKNRHTRSSACWRILQISLGGTDVWRRIVVPGSCCLEELHHTIQTIFDWKDSYNYQFSLDRTFQEDKNQNLDRHIRIGDLHEQGFTELLYEYGTHWTVKVMILSRQEEDAGEIRCVAGEGAAPPESIDGPLRYRKFLSALERGSDIAINTLGRNFDAEAFDLKRCNKHLASGLFLIKQGREPV
ncbi:MAG: plasmid pRiA4b ORF-3 family protein [Treponema sp.]|jgi:hypothetical protein|nr:plasmid pRiA4b ORF-3 family protein [Treponema sp.]